MWPAACKTPKSALNSYLWIGITRTAYTSEVGTSKLLRSNTVEAKGRMAGHNHISPAATPLAGMLAIS
jgi:hypothetical protein